MAHDRSMRGRRKSKIPVPALLIAGLTATIGAVGLTLDIANSNHPKEMAIGFVTCLAYPAMGLLIIRQQPRNAIGWLLLGIGLNTYVLFIDQGYAVFALIRHPGTLPAAQLFVWLGMWAWLPFILMLLLFLPMLFPDGRL